MPTTIARPKSKPSKQANVRYDVWLAQEIQASIDDPRPSIPHQKVMSRMKKLIKDLTNERQ